MSNLSDVQSAGSESEADQSPLDSAIGSGPVLPNGTDEASNTFRTNEMNSGSVVSISDDDENGLSDCEIVSVEDVHGEGKWRDIHSPIKKLNALLQAGFNDPSRLLDRMFGVNPDAIPTDPNQQWGLLLSLLSEPAPRRRLQHIHTLEAVLELLDTCRSVLVITGAGISVSCGIPDFRSRDGIYARLARDYPDLSSPQSMFDMKYFLQNPTPFFKFAKEIFPGQFTPSVTHRFVALLEEKGKLLRNYTQNIDTLEQAAGITKLIQCHGSFMTASCVTCHHRVPGDAIKNSVFAQRIPYCPRCRPTESDLEPPADQQCNSLNGSTQSTSNVGPCYGVMKPDIVFFGEDLSAEFHDALASDVRTADLVLVIGSSLKVRPVAHIPNSIPENVPIILINREPLMNHNFDVELFGDCDVIVKELCARLHWSLDPTDPCPEQRTLCPLFEVLGDRLKVGDDGSTSRVQPSSTRVQPDQSGPEKSIIGETSATLEPTTTNGHLSASTTTTAADDVVEVSDSEDDENSMDLVDVASLLPANSYTHIVPNQYVFPGAEFFLDVCDLIGDVDSEIGSDAHSVSETGSVTPVTQQVDCALNSAMTPPTSEAEPPVASEDPASPTLKRARVNSEQPQSP